MNFALARTTVDASGRTAWTWAVWGENDALVSLPKASGADGSGKTDPFDEGAPVDRFETRPDVEKFKLPKLPKELRDPGVEGAATIRIVIDRKGKAKSVELTEGVRDELDQKLVDAVRKWKYEPGKVQGKPVESVCRIIVTYDARNPNGGVSVSTRRWRN